MKYYKIDPRNPDPNIIKETVHCLDKGGVIVYPTDTLYGLGVDVFNRNAVHKLFNLKQRDMRRPVSIMLHSIQQIKEIFGLFPESIPIDMKKIFPGKMTAIIENRLAKKIPIFEKVDKPGTYFEKIGVRIPDHPVSNALSLLFDSPISSTSANLSGQGNVFTMQEIIAQFGPRLDLILDAGEIPRSKGSTILDMSKNPYLVVRSGAVPLEELQKKLGKDKVRLQKNKFTVTFVCSGNICRSPMAEGILKRIIGKTKYRERIHVDSAGTLPLPPSPAHDFAIQVCNDHGIDLQKHRSRHLNRSIMENSDLVLCMAQDHFTYMIKHFPHQMNKVALLKQWQRPHQLSIPSIADPIGHKLNFYQQTFDEIFNEIKRVLPAIFSRTRTFLEEMAS